MVLKPGVAPDVGDLLQQVKANARALFPRKIVLNNYLEVLASHAENGFRAVLVEIPRLPLFPPTTPTYQAGNVAAQLAVTSADGFTVLLQGPTALTWNDAIMALFMVVAHEIAQKVAETEKKAEPRRVNCPIHGDAPAIPSSSSSMVAEPDDPSVVTESPEAQFVKAMRLLHPTPTSSTPPESPALPFESDLGLSRRATTSRDSVLPYPDPPPEGYELHYLQEGRLDGKYIYVPGSRPPKPDMIPPPVGVKIGSKHAPWLELTEFEVGHERRRRCGMVPPDWMPNLEEKLQILSTLSRGLNNGRMARHAAKAGEEFLDEEPDIKPTRATLDELQVHVSGPIYDNMGNFTEQDMKRVQALATHLKGSNVRGYAAEEKGFKYTAVDLLDLCSPRVTNWKAFPELRRPTPPPVGSEAATAVGTGGVSCNGGTNNQPFSSAKQAMESAGGVEERDAYLNFLGQGIEEKMDASFKPLLDQIDEQGKKRNEQFRVLFETFDHGKARLRRAFQDHQEAHQGLDIIEEESKKTSSSKSKDRAVIPITFGQMKLENLKIIQEGIRTAQRERAHQSSFSTGNTMKATTLSKPNTRARLEETILTGIAAPVANSTKVKLVQSKSEGVGDLTSLEESTRRRKWVIRKAEASTNSPLRGGPELGDQSKDRIMNMHKAVKKRCEQASQLSVSNDGTTKVTIVPDILELTIEAPPVVTVTTGNVTSVVKDTKAEYVQQKSEGVGKKATLNGATPQVEKDLATKIEPASDNAQSGWDTKSDRETDLQGLDNIFTAPHMEGAESILPAGPHVEYLTASPPDQAFSPMIHSTYYETHPWEMRSAADAMPTSPSTHPREAPPVPAYTTSAQNAALPGWASDLLDYPEPGPYDASRFGIQDFKNGYPGYNSAWVTAPASAHPDSKAHKFSAATRQPNNSGHSYDPHSVSVGYDYDVQHTYYSDYDHDILHGTSVLHVERPRRRPVEKKSYEYEEAYRVVGKPLAPATAKALGEALHRNADLEAAPLATHGPYDASDRSYGNMSSAIPPFATNYHYGPPNDGTDLSFGDTSFDYSHQDEDLGDYLQSLNTTEFKRSLNMPVENAKDDNLKVELAAANEAPAAAGTSIGTIAQPHSTFGEWKRSLTFETTPNYGPLRKRNRGLMDSRHAVRPALASYLESDHKGDTVLGSEAELPEDLDSEYGPPEDFKVRDV
ncbi:hypothetical protein W97_00824 [Coniosporium apollinis CBS 100218]|uniref:Uncharacterized protein n=1 Tax=Coniosporium apollinis (strain CBS 100218) TaxID=1168221 RepID=R7YIK9_CONA1|nr:uncharacterized protein W97_00824 [Coniosporium apollinis CBS 100218]EON61609.1 hypothetical protein W97_00824 [Coniosporium apollinis CBS 100218]